MKKMQWEVTICEVENGYVARVGCKLFVFNEWKQLLSELEAYRKGEKTKLSKQAQPECVQTAPQPCETQQSITDTIAR